MDRKREFEKGGVDGLKDNEVIEIVVVVWIVGVGLRFVFVCFFLSLFFNSNNGVVFFIFNYIKREYVVEKKDFFGI